jgi:catechol 2,3-dioxygenase-like lactoylglutathione lyase family enzyme
MNGLIGINHVATVSSDLDRLVSFYQQVFGAECLFDEEIPFMPVREAGGSARHVFINLGGPTFLHAWQVQGVNPAEFDGEIFSRGRVDHFALAVETYADFERLRHALIGEGAADGEVNDFGVMLSFSFVDPDGLWVEVSWWKDGPNLNRFDAALVQDPIADKAPARAG